MNHNKDEARNMKYLSFPASRLNTMYTISMYIVCNFANRVMD